MQYYKVDAVMKLDVCAHNYEEARRTVIEGLDNGKYDSKYFEIKIKSGGELDEE